MTPLSDFSGLLGDDPALLASLVGVEVGGVNADPPLGLGMGWKVFFYYSEIGKVSTV